MALNANEHLTPVFANVARLWRTRTRAAGELPIGFGFQPECAQEFANPRASACGARKTACFEAPAGQMYTGSYHRAARRAADAITTPGTRIMIVSYAGADVSG